MRSPIGWCLAMLGVAAAGVAPAQVDVEPYLRRDAYEHIKISPDGRHYAATVPLADRAQVVVLDRASKGVAHRAEGVANSAVADLWWVDDDRIVVATAQSLGSKDPIYLTGELYGFALGDTRTRKLFGELPQGGLVTTYGDTGYREMATIIDPLPGDPDSVLIATAPLSSNPRTSVERMNRRNGRRALVATVPVRSGGFSVDAKGEVRFAEGYDDGNGLRLYYRDGADTPWVVVNDETASGIRMSALGLSADGRTGYLRVEQSSGPDTIESWDVATRARAVLLRDARVDPYAIIRDLDGRTPIGASYMDDGVSLKFFDEQADIARTYRRLEKAFPGSTVTVTSITRDGGLVLLRVWNDRMLGDYYLYDVKTRKADGVFARRAWLDPGAMSTSRPVSLTARDGVALRGYLNVPAGKDAKALPMVVLPHGGPYGVFEEWQADDDTQLLAAAGYAVLRIDYRGSGNAGRQFQRLGARQWGATMQDDVTDATRWAIAQGIADPARICIYGASYGGYAALMGVAREPDLYRCAVGYVGVYDLAATHRDASRFARWSKNWSNDWLGERADLATRSPVNLADRIKVPVFLAAGGADVRAPIAQSRKMEQALRDNKVPVESLYFDTEGHGFATQPHRRAFYTQLLDFLSRNIGGQKALAKSGDSGAE